MEKIKLLLESIVSDPYLTVNSAKCKVTTALNMLNKLETAHQNSSQLDPIVGLRGANIDATHNHDAGAFARCSYCGRYSDNLKSLKKEGFLCDCGENKGWCGSFKKPTESSVWNKAN